MSLTRRPGSATMADLAALPPTWRGEILDGELYAFPRPAFLHQHLEGHVFRVLSDLFQEGNGGPGGWWILTEPGIRISRSPEFSPDVAGWRKARMPRPPLKGPITIVPDWICEILSPGTKRYDLIVKRRFYAEIGVPFLWYLDPAVRTLSVSKLHEGHWVELGIHGPDEKIRAEPFQEVELDLSRWWRDLVDSDEDSDKDEDSAP